MYAVFFFGNYLHFIIIQIKKSYKDNINPASWIGVSRIKVWKLGVQNYLYICLRCHFKGQRDLLFSEYL